MVLTEFLNHASRGASQLRRVAGENVLQWMADPNIEVVPQTSAQFQAALERYLARLDQSWSVADCASFIVMETRQIHEALAFDHHFEQAGFTRPSAKQRVTDLRRTRHGRVNPAATEATRQTESSQLSRPAGGRCREILPGPTTRRGGHPSGTGMVMYIAHLHRWAIMTLDVACWRRPVPYHLDEMAKPGSPSSPAPGADDTLAKAASLPCEGLATEPL